LRLLAVREHSRAELRGKLLGRGADRDEVERLLGRLERERLLSDERFAGEYVEARRQRGFGPLRIRAELRERGVAEELIAGLLDEGDDAWAQAMHEAHDRRFGEGPPADLRDLARRGRFLAYRGFSGERVRRFLRFED